MVLKDIKGTSYAILKVNNREVLFCCGILRVDVYKILKNYLSL